MKAASLFDLAGQVALVTGASSGLGARFAQVLAANGAHVALAARRTERLEKLQGEIEARGGTAMAVPLDVGDRSAIPSAFDAVEASFGPVSILVNNAGIAVENRALSTTPDEWDAVRRINLDGPWFMSQEAGRRMVKAGVGGSIVNIASFLGLYVARGLAAYAVAKAGVVQLTRALALELAHDNIRVNAIAPGYIRTDMNREFLESEAGAKMIDRIPLRRAGEPEDLDGLMLWLASGASSFVTGSTILIDGGHGLTVG